MLRSIKVVIFSSPSLVLGVLGSDLRDMGDMSNLKDGAPMGEEVEIGEKPGGDLTPQHVGDDWGLVANSTSLRLSTGGMGSVAVGLGAIPDDGKNKKWKNE